MGHTRSTPITGETAAGVGTTYIVVDCTEDTVNIQTTAIGTVTTLTIDWTNDNILMGGSTAVNVVMPNDDRFVAPASATWEQIATAVGAAQLQFPVFAIRIDITAGTGSVRYAITQG